MSFTVFVVVSLVNFVRMPLDVGAIFNFLIFFFFKNYRMVS